MPKVFTVPWIPGTLVVAMIESIGLPEGAALGVSIRIAGVRGMLGGRRVWICALHPLSQP